MSVHVSHDGSHDPPTRAGRVQLAPSQRLSVIARPPHGGVYTAHLRALGMERDAILDASVNSNPSGPPPGVLAALREVLSGELLARYPDPEATLLREALAARHGVSISSVLVGNGSAELFWALALAYLDPGALALILGPAFGEYAVASQVAGASARAVLPAAHPERGWEGEALVEAVRQARGARVVWLANPANPTGQYLLREVVEAVLEACDGLLVLDEAYVNFVAGAWESVRLIETGRVALVRSLTKDYALAGLRLGYVLAHPTIIEALCRVRVPWSVNAVAQVAGCAALASGPFLAESRRQLLRDREALQGELSELGWRCEPSATHYFAARVPDAWESARAAQQALLVRGLMVRDCASFGLPRHVRIATRRPEQNAAIVARVRALDSERAGGEAGV